MVILGFFGWCSEACTVDERDVSGGQYNFGFAPYTLILSFVLIISCPKPTGF